MSKIKEYYHDEIEAGQRVPDDFDFENQEANFNFIFDEDEVVNIEDNV